MDAQLGRGFIRKGPANIIMAADVVDPGGFGMDGEMGRQRLGEQAHFAGGERIPEQGHQERVVGELAFLRVDILDHIIRMDNGF